MSLPLDPVPGTSVTLVTEGRGGFAYTRRDGIRRYFNFRTRCWESRTSRDPQPPPTEPKITGGGTPDELAARAISEGKFELAGWYLLQGESEHGLT